MSKLLFALLLAALSPCTWAQSWTAAGSSPFLWSNQSSLGVYRSVNTMMLGRLPGGTNGTPAPAATAVPQRLPLSATAFARDPHPLMPAKMARAAGGNTAELVQTYAAILESYDQLLRDSGESARLGSNVSGALLFLLASAHYVQSGGKELSTGQQELILQDLNSALGQTPQFTALSNAQKQELFETAAIAGAYALTMYRVGVEQKSQQHVGIAREVAKLGMEQVFGVPVERFALQRGLRLR